MAGRIEVGVPQVMAGSAAWAAQAATFADAVPPAITSTWPSAAAVGAIHGMTSASHAAFGARLAETAGHTQAGAAAFVVQEVEQNVVGLKDVIPT